MEVFGVKFAPLNVPMKRRLQTLTVALWFVWIVTGGFIGLFTLLYIILFTRFYWLGCLYAIWIYYDRHSCETGGRRLFCNWFRKWSIWNYLRDYFPMKLIRNDEAKLDPSRNYLFCCFPHGVLCSGLFGNLCVDAGGFRELFPGMTPYFFTLDLHFNQPFFREFLYIMGTCSSSAESISYILSSPGSGRIGVLAVGGAAEALYCRPGQYQIILKRRKGFVKLALKNGTPLVPVFSFGETDLFTQLSNPEGSLLRRAQEFIRKIIGIAPVVFIGRGFFQYSFGAIPRRALITTVVGTPIEVERVEHPTEEQINQLHEKFTNELIKMFEEGKHKYLKNPDQTELIIT